ncbi:hypothetical protein [Pseudanabaena minima]|uniref:hypothetical protein n=1 Tax=Pseudanabaena minima TaxID=890415 RepID=UPI003DA98940
MSKSKMTKCPKCGEKSFKEIKENVFKCVSCNYRKDLNDPDYGWFMPSLTVGGLSGLMIAIVGFLFIFRVASSNLSNPIRNQTDVLAPEPEIIPASISNIREPPTQTVPKVIAKPMPKPVAKPVAKSGNQVILEISGKPQTVLLCGLNAPTPNSPLFAAATQNLQQLLDLAGTDNLFWSLIDNDKGIQVMELYDRRVQGSINAQQAASGYATSSQFLAKLCRDRVQILASVQLAREQQKGLWKP